MCAGAREQGVDASAAATATHDAFDIYLGYISQEANLTRVLQ
jgi:hypothetical protein